MKNITRRLALLALVPTLTVAATFSNAQDVANFPDKEITMIVPVKAGGGTDLVARAVAELLGNELGTTIVIKNAPGGSGVIGLNELIAADKDGYTMGIWSNRGMITSVLLGEGANFDENSFEYLAGVNVTADLILAAPGKPYTNAKEFAEYATAHPGEVLIGVPGAGPLVTAVLAQVAMDIQLTPLRFQGGNGTLTAVMGGSSDTGVLTAAFAETAADQNMAILGVASDERLESIPDVPTFIEQGYDMSGAITRVFILPDGVPETIIAKYAAAFDAIAAGPLPDKLREIKEIPLYRDRTDIAEYLKKNYAKMRRVIEDNRDAFISQ